MEKKQYEVVMAMAQLERTYNVPLRRGFRNTPRHKRAKKATKVLKEFLMKHMKTDEVKLGQHLNHHIWENGIKNPPHHVKVKAVKDEDGVVKAELEGKEYTEPVRPQEPSEDEGGLKERLAGQMGMDTSELEGAEEELAEKTQEQLEETGEEESEGAAEKEVPSRSTVSSMTKDEIKDYAADEWGVELSTNDLKDEMINRLFEEIE